MRATLMELRSELEGLVKTGADAAQVVELDQSKIGRLSRMDALQAQAMAQASGRRREMMLRKIAAALTRIDNDDYGFCKSCEEEIHRKRLEFDPTAVLCIQCAKKAEDLSAR